MIDLDQMPPDWKFAQNHAKAVKPGLVDDINILHTKNVYCTCCLKPIIKNDVSLCGNSKELEFLGFGFPLYFIFIKYCIVLLLILICSYSSISLYWAIKDNYQLCSGHHRLLSGGQALCTSFMIRFAHIQSQISNQEMILRITSFVIHFAALLYIRDHIQKTKQYYDQKTTTFSDYSIMFRNLPSTGNIQAKIKKFINQHFKQEWKELQQKYTGKQFKNPQKVIEITLIPDTQKFYQLIQQKKTLIQQKRKIIIDIQKNSHKVHQAEDISNHKIYNKENLQNNIQQYSVNLRIIQQKISQKAQQINKLCALYQKKAANDQLHCEISIVTLNTQIFKNTVLDSVHDGKINKQILQIYFGQNSDNIQIFQAPEPTQIIWQNVNYPMQKRLGRKVMGWVFTILFLAVTTIGFYFLLLLKTVNLLHAIEEHDDRKHSIAVFLVFLSLFLIVFFNKLFMGWVLHHFAHMEKHYNTFQEEFSFGLKYTLGLFFTTALMTLAVQAITFHNFYAHEFGVIEEQSIMFFINAFFIPLFWFINPWQLFNLFKRFLYKNKKHLTQAQANHIMSDAGYTMGKRYAEIIQTMWFTFLYATLIPIGAFLTIIGLSLYYWVDKFNLLRRSSLKNNISGKMAIKSLKLLDLTLILRPLGQLLFDKQMRHDYSISTLIFIIIGGLYFILPIEVILQFVHNEQFQQQQKSFDEVKDQFLETYQTLHPIFGYKSSEDKINHFRRKTNNSISLSKIQSNQFILQKKTKNNVLQQTQIIQKDQSSSMDMTLRLIPHTESINNNKTKFKQQIKSDDRKKDYEKINNSSNIRSQKKQPEGLRATANNNSGNIKKSQPSIDRKLQKTNSGKKVVPESFFQQQNILKTSGFN